MSLEAVDVSSVKKWQRRVYLHMAFVGRDITGKAIEDMVYEAQRKVILELAGKEPCVIDGM